MMDQARLNFCILILYKLKYVAFSPNVLVACDLPQCAHFNFIVKNICLLNL